MPAMENFTIRNLTSHGPRTYGSACKRAERRGTELLVLLVGSFPSVFIAPSFTLPYFARPHPSETSCSRLETRNATTQKIRFTSAWLSDADCGVVNRASG